MAIGDKERKRLILLLGMTTSPHDGEALNALRLAQRLIGAAELTWEEVLKPHGGADEEELFRRAYQGGYDDGYQVGYKRGVASVHVRTTELKPVGSWRAFAKELNIKYHDRLNDWEVGFVGNYVARGFATPTPKQRAVFQRIAAKLELQCPEE